MLFEHLTLGRRRQAHRPTTPSTGLLGVAYSRRGISTPTQQSVETSQPSTQSSPSAGVGAADAGDRLAQQLPGPRQDQQADQEEREQDRAVVRARQPPAQVPADIAPVGRDDQLFVANRLEGSPRKKGRGEILVLLTLQ